MKKTTLIIVSLIALVAIVYSAVDLFNKYQVKKGGQTIQSFLVGAYDACTAQKGIPVIAREGTGTSSITGVACVPQPAK